MLTVGQNIVVVAWKWLNPIHILPAKANTNARVCLLCLGGLKLRPNITFRKKKRSIKRLIRDDVCGGVWTDQGIDSHTNFGSDHGKSCVCPSGCLALPYTTVSFIFALNHAFFTPDLALFPRPVPWFGPLRDEGRDTERFNPTIWDCCYVFVCAVSQYSQYDLPGSKWAIPQRSRC